jgi:hypothetical protein
LGAKFVVSIGAVAGLKHKRIRRGLGPGRSVSDEPVTSRHGSVEMSTLAGQLLTKKIVVGFNPAARSYLFNVGLLPLECHWVVLERRSNFGFRAQKRLDHIKEFALRRVRYGRRIEEYQNSRRFFLTLLIVFAYNSFTLRMTWDAGL